MKRPKDDDKDDSTMNNTSLNMSIGGNGNEAGLVTSAVRTTGRVKKPKQVYDPSDNYISRGARNSMPATATGAGLGSGILSTAMSIPSTPLPMNKRPGGGGIREALSSSLGEVLAALNEEQQQQRNMDTCVKCSKSEPKRGSGHKSNFITCKTCMQKCHFACLTLNFENLSTARKKYKCGKCRYCVACNNKSKDLLLCTGCVEAYHFECHKPPLKASTLGDPKWKCHKCDAAYNTDQQQPRKSYAGRRKRIQSQLPVDRQPSKFLRAKSEERIPSHAIDPIKIPEPVTVKQDLQKQEEDDVSLITCTPLETPPPPPLAATGSPNGPSTNNKETPPSVLPAAQFESEPVAHWSVDQVVSFVAKHYPSEASVFRYQDIDGASLLLLTRKDIINGFGLKLGPSLRLFELITSLQNSADDVALAWSD